VARVLDDGGQEDLTLVLAQLVSLQEDNSKTSGGDPGTPGHVGCSIRAVSRKDS